MNRKQRLLTLSLLLMSSFLFAQPEVVSWDFATERTADDTLTVILTAEVDPGWYVYSQYLESDEGPIATKVNFDDAKSLELIGKAEESGELVKGFDEIFGMNISKYKNKLVIRQRLLLPKGVDSISGTVLFMSCDHEQCLPPQEVAFTLPLE